MKKLLFFTMMYVLGLAISLNAQTTFTYDFEDGFQDWTNIDADGDGYNWIYNNANATSISTHDNSVGSVYSQSYDANAHALTPDNYLVSPEKYAVLEGATITFWACAQDLDYPAEHIGVAVSTSSNTSASDFTTIAEWTMTAKSTSDVGAQRGDSTRDPGTWYEYTVDLSEYAGQNLWVAIRHFNCYDQFSLVVDDVEIYTANIDDSYVAQVNDVKYESMQEAVNAASAYLPITLLKNVEGPAFNVEKTVTINLNGKTYTINNDNPINLSAGTLTLQNGTIAGKGGYTNLINITGSAQLVHDAAIIGTMTKSVAATTEGWGTISSPVGTVNHSQVDGFFTYQNFEDMDRSGANGATPRLPERFLQYDQYAPIGSGWLLLVGMGAVYAMLIRGKEK